MLKIEYLPRARFDIDSISTYYILALKAHQAATDFLDELYKTIERTAELPELGRLFEEADFGKKSMYSLLVKQYRVFYTFDEDALTIWRVLHTSQDMSNFAYLLLDEEG